MQNGDARYRGGIGGGRMACMEETDKTYTAWGIGEGVHETTGLKPMLTPKEQVALLKAKGVTFERCDEEKAVRELSDRDTLLHIAAFRRMFQRHTDGENAGKYVELDFADLLDMESLDSEVRRSFLLASQDVERVVKTRLMERISAEPGEDGYGILADFMKCQTKSFRKSIARNLETRAEKPGGGDEYTGSLIAHYGSAMPSWVFLEVVPFGTKLALYLFCANRWGDRAMRQKHSALTEAKAVRNCCSHGSCLINGFSEGKTSAYETPHFVIKWLEEHGFKGGKSRRAKMGNRRTQQLIACLALLDDCGDYASSATLDLMRGLKDALEGRAERYGQENSFVSYLSFIAKAIDSMT